MNRIRIVDGECVFVAPSLCTVIGTTAAILGAAAIGAGGGLLSGSMQSGAINDASAVATAESARQFNIGQANQQPWLVTGTSALNKLGSMYGLDTYQPNYAATTGGAGAQTPGVQAALAGGMHSDNNLAQDLLFGPGISGLFRENASPLQDIAGALQTGAPISDASWAAAGYGPGGAALNGSTPNLGTVQQPTGGTTNQPNVAQGAAGTSAGTFTPGSAQPGVDPYADFYKSPDYLFRKTEGLAGVDAGAAAGGSLDSGATRKAEIAYAGNLAAGEFDSYADRLSLLAGVGQTTATNMAGQGASYANNVGDNAMWKGGQLASSYGSTVGNLAGIGSGLIQNFGQPPNAGYAAYNTTSGNWTPGPQGF